MADVNANIGVSIDTSDALNQLKSLQRQISQFHQSVAKSSSSAAIAQRDLQKNFINGVNAIKGFSAELRTVRGTAESFTNSLEKNKFSIQQYFRYAASQTKTFGKNFSSEFSTIEKTAIERVKTLQTQYVKMGRDAQGAMQAIAIRPTVLNMKDLGTQTAIAAQKQVLFNQLVKQGSTNLLNFGKNTQWAGRQLMVGFTLPLATLGMTAGRVFMDMEKAAIRFKKVYGDLFTAPAETQQALDSIVELGLAYTKYGVAVSDAISVASDAAAAGFQGVDLQNQTTASLKLSVLGQMELQKALETTIALQNAFRISSTDLAGTIDFLNAVENQTVVSLDDITEAVPRVAPVIQALGGDVKDLAFFLAAMKEGGVNAAQGANALKSGLASLINPTERASQLLAGMGVNIRAIVSQNQGDLRGTVVGFAQALDKLDPMKRAQAIEQLFGKFQFARISALFDNVIKDGSQASRVLDLAGSSVEDLASLSEKELGVSAASAMNKFRASIEQVKVALAPIGELFLKIATPFIDFVTTVLKAFNALPDGIKQVIGTIITVVGGLGPVLLMTFGLINNGIANMIKFFATVRLGYLKMTGQAKGIGDETQYMTQEQLEAAAAAASLDQAHAGLTQRFTAEKTAVDALRAAYEQAAAAGARFASINPGMMRPGSTAKLANGGFVSGSGSGDTVPAMLTPGEFVIKKKEAQIFLPLLQAINDNKVPGFADGGLIGKGFSNATMFLPESINTTMGGTGEGALTGDVTSYIKQSAGAAMAPLMAVMAREIGIKLNDPSVFKEWQGLGDTLATNAINALEQSGKQFITDDDFEQIVVPAMKKSAENISVAGKQVKTALNNAFEQIRTVAPLGANSGTIGGAGRVSLPGSYRSARVQSQKFALQSNPEMFRQTERMSQSRAKIVNSFQTKNIATDNFEVATMSHLTRSITTSVNNLIAKVAPYLGDQSARIVNAVSKSTVDGIKVSTSQASPSKEAYTIGENIGKGTINGIRSQVDDAKTSGEQLGSATVQGVASVAKSGPRRFSTDPAVMAALQSQATQDSASIAAGTSRQPRRATREADSTAPAPKSSLVASRFTDNLQKASFAVSSVTGILYMFGNDLGGIIPAISGISAAMFGLISISQALQGTFIAAAVAKRAEMVASSMGATANAAGVKTLSSLFVQGKGVAGLFTNLITGFKAVIRFLGVAGLVISALAIAIPFVINLYQQQRDKMEAFGKIVDVTADQIKFLGQQAGESVTTGSGFDRATLGQAETATDAANEKAADEQFLEQFKTQIAATKAGALDSVNQALELLAFKLSSAGLSDQIVSSTIAGIIQASNRTDLEFDFNKVGLSPANTAGLLTDLKSRIATAAETQKTQTAGPGGYARGPGATQDTQALKDIGANAAALMEGLAIQLEARTITIEEYSAAFNNLRLSLVGLEGAAKETAIGEAIDKIFPEDKDMATAIKGVEDLEQQMLLLELAGVGGSDSMQEFVDKTEDSTTSKAQYVAQIKKEIAAQRKLNIETSAAIAISEQETEADALRDKINVYDELVAAGLTAAEAYRIAGDAALTEGYKTALAAGDLQKWIDGVNEFASLTAQFESRRPTGGGGGQKSPFQEAIDGLKEQQAEAKNSIMAYAKLRSAGLGVAEAAEIAKDSMLAAALASQKVGSAGYNQLVTAIRAARAEEEAWLNSTPEGRAEQFADVYSKVMDVFNAQEAVLEMNNESATAANRKIIETLEKQIDAYQRRSSELERDLDKISEKEDEINKAYDEKNKSLEKVKKLNQDILNQQKSQLSIADALSQGDIGAAATAIQDSRAQNAAAQGDAVGNALDASRQAQLSALTQNGRTRAQIEAEIKQIKKDVEIIEFGALQNARDAVVAADEALAKAKENLTVQGQSKTEWENINTRIDASKANAALYEAEVLKALENAKGLVGEWSKLQDTFTTTHIVNTIATSNGSGAPAATTTTSGQSSTSRPFVPTGGRSVGGVAFVAKGGYIKPMAMAAGGFAKGTDTVPAMLTPGEYVINRASTKRFAPLLQAINSGNFKYSTPSGPTVPNNFLKPVYNMPEKSYAPADGAMPLNSQLNTASSLTSQDNSVYNYSLSVNVDGTNASPDQIANVVMKKLQGIDSQRVRRQVIR